MVFFYELSYSSALTKLMEKVQGFNPESGKSTGKTIIFLAKAAL